MCVNLEVLSPTKFNFRDAMSPSGNTSEHPEPTKKQQQPSRAHQEIIVTIQNPPGNISNHPPGNNRQVPCTLVFLHFQGAVPNSPIFALP